MNVKILPKNEYSVNFATIEEIARKLRLDKRFVELMFSRGLCDEKTINSFLHPKKEMFYDPFLMKGMSEAVDRLNRAIENREKVVVYGDYDADGVCASSILSLYLSTRGLDVLVHIPNRIGEGYGLNVESLGRIIENEMPDLILTCDCGISGANEVRFVLDLGVDIIVTDHHEISGEIPECIVVNPKQEDCSYPDNMLCGAGVALKLIEALSDRQTMLEYIDLACVATIADLVPLVNENRLIVQFGLQKINERKNLGLRLLFDKLKVENVTSGDIAYKIAPRINAAGRMGDAYRAFELLTEKDVNRVREIVAEIEEDNSKRKEICDEMYNEAVGDLEYEDLVNNRAIILSHPDWEKGITGIVAARLAGDYNRPSFILVKSGDTYKGTCRSVDGINVHELLSYCRDTLVEFGGHSQAAGFSILPDKISEFKVKVNEFLKKYDDELFLPQCRYDMEIEVSDVTYDFVQSLDLLEPTGNGNVKPLFKITLNEAKISPCKNNQSHISVMLDSGFQLFAFNYSKLAYQFLAPGKKTIVTELQTSSYGGKQVKGIIRACSPENLYINDLAAQSYFYGLLKYIPSSSARYTVYKEEDIENITLNQYGTLIVAGSRESYEKFISLHSRPMFSEYMYATTKGNFTRIIVAPVMENNLSFANYNRIIFLDAPLNNGVISHLNRLTKAEIFVPEQFSEKYEVSTDRDVFAKYFELIRSAQNAQVASQIALFKHLAKTNDISLNQFVFCISVFEDLGIIRVSDTPFRISVNRGVRADLTKSKIYNLVKEKTNG